MSIFSHFIKAPFDLMLLYSDWRLNLNFNLFSGYFHSVNGGNTEELLVFYFHFSAKKRLSRSLLHKNHFLNFLPYYNIICLVSNYIIIFSSSCIISSSLCLLCVFSVHLGWATQGLCVVLSKHCKGDLEPWCCMILFSISSIPLLAWNPWFSS